MRVALRAACESDVGGVDSVCGETPGTFFKVNVRPLRDLLLPQQMSRGSRQGVHLPHALQKELGLDLNNSRKRHGTVADQKAQRKAGRVEKRRGTGGHFQHGADSRSHSTRKEQHGADLIDREQGARQRSEQNGAARAQPAQSKPLKSILKKRTESLPYRAPSQSDDSDSQSRSLSPELVLDPNSKSYRDRLAQDDAEISSLEKRLGLKSKKSDKSFDDDGLEGILDGIGSDDESRKRKRESREWLESKRQKVHDLSDNEEVEGMSINDSSEEDDLDHASALEDVEGDTDEGSADESAAEDASGNDDDDDFEAFEGEVSTPQEPLPKIRENPYVPPVSAATPTAKYVPPSLRRSHDEDNQGLERLNRQLKGQLNKLSEANLISILKEVEGIYQTNARQDTTTVLIDLLLGLICNNSTLPNTFVILHAGFAAAVYKVIGTDFGAELLTKLVERFEHYHGASDAGKEALNLVSLLSNFFAFSIVSSTLVLDHIRLLLTDLSENNTELLLRIIRDCGPQLRSEDPASLKQIVQLTQAVTDSSSASSSVRTKFMIETITDLKNNKMRDSTSTSSLTKEHITRMRKILGSLNNRPHLRATEPLRITLEDLKNTEKRGKWWLVGASWKGNEPQVRDRQPETLSNVDFPTNEFEANDEPDISALARQHRLNTPLHLSIFAALMTASNYEDAFVRLTKLRLKASQQPEIAKVLVRCCGAEETYNPYYALVLKRFCTVEGGKKTRKSLEFAFWGFLKRLGETGAKDEEDDDDTEDEAAAVEMAEVANVAKMYAFLIQEAVVSVAALRVLDLAYLKEKAELFVEMLLVQILVLCEGLEARVAKVFERAVETPQVVSRLKLFLKKHVKKSDLVTGKDEKEMVRKGCRIALHTLNSLESDSKGLG